MARQHKGASEGLEQKNCTVQTGSAQVSYQLQGLKGLSGLARPGGDGPGAKPSNVFPGAEAP